MRISEPQAQGARQTPVDLVALRAALREAGIEDAMEPILTAFLDDAPQSMERLNLAMAEKEITEIQSAAHAMKGASGTIKADALADLLRQVEEAARTDDLECATGLHDRVRHEYDTVMVYLERARDGRS